MIQRYVSNLFFFKQNLQWKHVNRISSGSQIILKYYEQQTHREKSGTVTNYSGRAAIGEGRIASYRGRSPVVSRFSSRGPDFVDIKRNPTDVLKPDILAPGHQIWAAWSPMSALDPILSGISIGLEKSVFFYIYLRKPLGPAIMTMYYRISSRF